MRAFLILILVAAPGLATRAAQSVRMPAGTIETLRHIEAAAGRLRYPQGVAVASDGTVFVADTNADRVLRVGRNGDVTVIRARLPYADGLAVDASGTVYVAVRGGHGVWRIGDRGWGRVAGDGRSGGEGDGGPASSARLSFPAGVAVDSEGILYIADLANHRIRRVAADGRITTIAGTGRRGFSGDGGPAVAAELSGPEGVAVDASGHLYIADHGNGRIRRVSPDGLIATVAKVNGPIGLAVDGAGVLFVAESTNNRVVRVDPTGAVTVVAGTGRAGMEGDGGPATAARLNRPEQIAIDYEGDLLIADTYNHRIRKVTGIATPPPRAVRRAVMGSSITGTVRMRTYGPGLRLALDERAGSAVNRRFVVAVTNRADLPADLFRPAPDLPPCGQNRSASRTWVAVYQGDRVVRYCGFTSVDELAGLRVTGAPGTRVFLQMEDRETDTFYASNVVVLP